ncbi:hypothetical protein ALP32_200047 [Pseudomonas avellanae]|uniref:Uncharacterized protein n=1 Tax=Pseudomonas avellanae TaxID=46257 RepID=A0A3M5U028_9PSED|nr:hypothetical protein ALP32_200047 [Pseudomonas avellanae]
MRYLCSENPYQQALMQVISPLSLGVDAPSPLSGLHVPHLRDRLSVEDQSLHRQPADCRRVYHPCATQGSPQKTDFKVR